MLQLVVTLLGTLVVVGVIGFGFGGRVSLPRFGRGPGAARSTGGPEEPEAAPAPRAEAGWAQDGADDQDEGPGWRPGGPPDPDPGQEADDEDGPVPWQPPRARRWRLRDAGGRTIGLVERIEDRDAVLGPYTVRIADYRLTIRTGLEHARLLAPKAVAAALDELAAAPQDEHARDRAVDALTSRDLWARGGPQRQETLLLSVLACDRGTLLDEVLVLRSQGVVSGVGVDPERPRDRFEHALGRTEAAARQLDDDPALARALVDRFCPREPQALGPLDDLILAAIRPAAA